MSLYVKALEISKIAHEGQMDKAGVDYIQHPIYVASLVNTEEQKAVALLHDVIEDSEITKEDLIHAGISTNVVEAVNTLTKVRGESYINYLKKVKSNNLARVVKLADLQHNSDLTRIKKPNKKDFERLEKYKQAIEYLS